MYGVLCVFYRHSEVAFVFEVATGILPNKEQLQILVIISMETEFAITPFFVGAAPVHLVLDALLPKLTRP